MKELWALFKVFVTFLTVFFEADVVSGYRSRSSREVYLHEHALLYIKSRNFFQAATHVVETCKLQ